MSRAEPECAVFLAAELFANVVPRYKRATSPAKAAYLAHELCRLGRRYFKLSELLCSYPDEYGWEKRRERIGEKMRKLCDESPFNVELDSDGGGLGIVAITPKPCPTRTALR